jgi:hypothetical protein
MPVLFYEVGTVGDDAGWRYFVSDQLSVSIRERAGWYMIEIERHDGRRPDDADVAAAFARFIPAGHKMIAVWGGMKGEAVRRYRTADAE